MPDDGSAPYTPTRLEWLATQANLAMGKTLQPGDDWSIFFKPEPPNTILVSVTYHALRTEVLTRRANFAVEMVHETAKLRGWDKWLNVRSVFTDTSS